MVGKFSLSGLAHVGVKSYSQPVRQTLRADQNCP